MQPGDVLDGRFEITRFAASGGMGSVYEARDRSTGGAVALKTMADASPRFLREAHALASLCHPAIVRYVAHGELPGGGLYLVMDWLAGETLNVALRRGPLAIDDAVALGVRLAGALGHAHALGFLHRDIKPRNVLLTPPPMLVDFGLVRWLEGPALTRTGAFLGTPGFVAPEQAFGDRDVDSRADVYALGCVLYASLTGAPPFGKGAVLSAESLFCDPPRVRDRRPSVPPLLDALLASMLAHDRALRPSADAVVLSLQGVG